MVRAMDRDSDRLLLLGERALNKTAQRAGGSTDCEAIGAHGTDIWLGNERQSLPSISSLIGSTPQGGSELHSHLLEQSLE